MARKDRGGAQVGSPIAGKGASSREAKGRVCSRPGCTTILSTYNRDTECSVHSEPTQRHALHP
jgi:hypothetical protein